MISIFELRKLRSKTNRCWRSTATGPSCWWNLSLWTLRGFKRWRRGCQRRRTADWKNLKDWNHTCWRRCKWSKKSRIRLQCQLCHIFLLLHLKRQRHLEFPVNILTIHFWAPASFRWTLVRRSNLTSWKTNFCRMITNQWFSTNMKNTPKWETNDFRNYGSMIWAFQILQKSLRRCKPKRNRVFDSQCTTRTVPRCLGRRLRSRTRPWASPVSLRSKCRHRSKRQAWECINRPRITRIRSDSPATDRLFTITKRCNKV